ncbi:MAG: hypothetical protein LBU25_04980, partial [Treponema sp.]|nr:hypothetical protein [Treponema sp.]
RQLDKIVDTINNRPRKVLGYLTPYEVFRHKIRTSEKNPQGIFAGIWGKGTRKKYTFAPGRSVWAWHWGSR